MISGASEEELELANARANIIMKLDNTSTYESWLIVDTYLEQLEKEKQELKLELSGYRQAILNDKEMLGLKEQNQKLKKQLETCYCNRTDCIGRIKDSKVYDSLEQKIETQQKEFIKYLEDKIKKEKEDLEQLCDLYKIPKENNGTYKFVHSYINKIEEILQKYKEIIGRDK